MCDNEWMSDKPIVQAKNESKNTPNVWQLAGMHTL